MTRSSYRCCMTVCPLIHSINLYSKCVFPGNVSVLGGFGLKCMLNMFLVCSFFLDDVYETCFATADFCEYNSIFNGTLE